MAKKLPTVWKMEPHTEAKHIILRRYLQAWFPIMTRWNGRVLYIDGFAGPGKYIDGQIGSPIIALGAALEVAPKMTGEMSLLFIELDPKRLEVLKQEVAEFALPKNIAVDCVHGKFDETMTGILASLEEQRKRLAPTFAFLDPFGFSHTPFSVVQKIMANQKCEVLITFMYEEINRFLEHPDQPTNYDELFGGKEWRDAIPIKEPQPRKKFIHDLYRRQIEEKAGVRYVRSFEMINHGNRTDYFLFFGTNNLKGLARMKEAMWKVDEGAGMQFSDTTDMNQTLLFAKEPDFGDVKRRIVAKFSGLQVAVEKIEEFVLVQTPYRETHYKTQVLKPMEKSEPPELIVVSRPGRGAKGTFPEGTQIKFA